MDLDRAAASADSPVVDTRERPLREVAAESGELRPLGAVVTTPVLRRCTALATRARVEMLSGGRHPAAKDLLGVLEEIRGWGERELLTPDPTMLALSAASLQDLAERLPDSEDPALASAVGSVLGRLHRELEGASLAAPL